MTPSMEFRTPPQTLVELVEDHQDSTFTYVVELSLYNVVVPGLASSVASPLIII
jgi:hypothetical protein